MLHHYRKRTFASAVSILFIVAFPLLSAAQANLNISNAIGTVGDTVAITVELSGTENAAGIEFHLSYSSLRLSYVQTSSEVLTDMTIGNVGSTVNVVWDNIINPINATNPVNIAMIEFEILPGLPDSTEILLTAAEIVDDLGDPYSLTMDNGWIIINQSTDVFDNDTKTLPDDCFLEANRPNPFNSSTVISFGLPRLSHVSLTVFNIIGQKVSILIDKQLKAGYHSYIWNGEKSASGVYFYQLRAGEFLATHKMILLQ